MPGVAAEAPDLVDARCLVGETLAGRFRIERLVAEGGFGVVYRAQQVALDRPVAIKVFKPASDFAAPEVRGRGAHGCEVEASAYRGGA